MQVPIRTQLEQAGTRRRALLHDLKEVNTDLKALMTLGHAYNFPEADMARLAGVAQATVAKWVQGKTSSDYRQQRDHCTYPHGKCLKEVVR